MKNLILLGWLLVVSMQLPAQTLNCSNICVTNVTFNNLTGNIDVTVINADTNQINYPIIQLVDVNGDTIGNPTGQFFLFAQLAGQLVTHEVPSVVPSLPFGFFGTVIITDPIFNNTCSFTYPMACFTGNPWPDCNSMSVENLNLIPGPGLLEVTLFNNCLNCASGIAGPVYCEMTVIHNVAPFDTIANSACYCFMTPDNLSPATYILSTTLSSLPPVNEILVLMHCGGGSCDTLVNSPTLGVLNSIINNPFSVYPNPASDLVSIINPGNIKIDAVIVYDLNGKQINYATSSLNFINVRELNSGLYIVKIISRESSFSVKLMVN